MLTPNLAIPNILNTPDVATPLSFTPGRPVVLFPVRLETRFFTLPDDSSELRVRVYPDTVHIDSHEPELTSDEQIWGRHFWEETWRAATDKERAKSAWRQLADRFDPPRAAWIARALRPLNPDDRPEDPVPANEALRTAPRFPTVASKAEEWTRAPFTRVLPNQWIVLGYKDGRLVLNVTGNAIPDSLPTGPDPKVNEESPPTTEEQLGIDDEMKWMVDFDVAEEKGMGIRVKMKKEDAAVGLDFLLVFGIKDSPESTSDGTSQLAELFNAHHYTDGLSFVLQGTPSNNTVDAPSGFSSTDLGHEASYEAERAALGFKPGDGSNADVLTAALGLANSGPVLANLPNALAKEQLDAREMNTALWQATWGYFLLQMLGVGETSESPLTDADIDWVRSHFIDYVRASGPLPALRIGKQPYGILPVTSLSEWKPPKGKENLYGRDLVLQPFLKALRDVWRRNYTNVPRLGRTQDTDQEKGIDKDLAEVLSMDARSSSYSVRNLMGRHYLEHLWVFLSAEYYMDVWGEVIEEPPPEPEPFEPEEPPDDIRPADRIRWIREQQRLRQLAERQRAQWEASIRARERRIAFIAAKRAATQAWWTIQGQLTTTLLPSLGVSWKPRVARGVYASPVTKLTGALVQPSGPSLSPNYIEALLSAKSIDDIRHDRIQPAPQPTLLYLLLRHSMLLEYGNAGSRLLISKELMDPKLRRERELVNLSASQSTPTIWDQLEKSISVSGQEVPLKTYLLGSPDGEAELKPLSDFRASLSHLKSLDVNRLEELMSGTLDLASHRLDAWITSFATKRLAEMRGASATGVLFGGYGWVTNLKPAGVQVEVPAPSGVEGPVFQLTNNPGFVHTPSLTQASTVAVLRSGHLAHAGNQMPNDLLAIDLSSERVRLASWLLDGVRQGQPLGALLGYRFERRLQEASSVPSSEIKPAKFIPAFRELAPLVAKKLEQTSQPVENPSVEAVAANNVVDGLQLHSLWQDTQKDPFQAQQKENEFFAKLPSMTQAERTALRLELMALNDSVDAVSDALMAETVFQVVRGNPLRVASTVEAISGGETPPPELEVVRTPRSGIALTHRLVTLFTGDPVLPAGWGPPGIPFRANAEPHLNAWVAKLLRNPLNVRCLVDRLEPGTGKVLETRELRLNQLRLAPIDFIYAVEGGEGGQQSEIEQRIMYGIMRKADGFAPGSLLRVNPGRRAEWPATDLGYGEFNELVRTARKLITGARAIDGGDLDLPERNTEFSLDIVELEKRVTAAEVFLRRTPNDFKTLLAAPEAANLDPLRDLILRSAAYGVAGAVPLSAAGASPQDRQTLFTQAASIQKELIQRVEQLKALVAGFNASTATVEARRDHAIARLHIVFGKQFIVLPRFTPANPAELEQALADSTKLQDGDPFVSTTWFKRMARVREGVSRLNAALNYSEALKTGEALKLNIVQLPHNPNDRWVGLPLKPPGESLPGGKLSIAIQSAAPLDVRKPLAGLLIDEWVEVVPSATETTAIALQYDRPSAAPPQTILIAVPPELEVPWTVWSLQQVLLETLDLARIRAVDPDALNEVGHYLPALYFALNIAGETISADFSKLRS